MLNRVYESSTNFQHRSMCTISVLKDLHEFVKTFSACAKVLCANGAVLMSGDTGFPG